MNIPNVKALLLKIEGMCPECASVNTEVVDSSENNMDFISHCECEDCGTTFNEIRNLEFSHKDNIVVGGKTYAPMSKDIKATEWWSHCDTVVTINTHYHEQKCPECGEPIKPCSNCVMDKVECHECPLDILNEKEEIK